MFISYIQFHTSNSLCFETKKHRLSCSCAADRYVMWTGGRWGPEGSTLPPAAHSKAAQLGQKLSIGLEAAYQVSVCYIPNALRTSLPSSCQYCGWALSERPMARKQLVFMSGVHADAVYFHRNPFTILDKILASCGPDVCRKLQKKGQRRLAQQHQTRNVEEVCRRSQAKRFFRGRTGGV